MTRHTETIEWIPVDEQMPDDGMTVLIAFELADPWLGWHEDGQWRQVDSAPVDGVTHWAVPPEGPAPPE